MAQKKVRVTVSIWAFSVLFLAGCAGMQKTNVPSQKTEPEVVSAASVLDVSPQKVVLMLPNQGRFSRAASAIKSGFMTAATGSGVEVVQQDIAGVPEMLMIDYERASQSGADLIVGPLSKGSVTMLATQQNLSTPVLGLNYSQEMTMNDDMVQFSLAPEQEAISAAEYARQRGFFNAAVFYPNNALGARQQSAFVQAFSTGGGQVFMTEEYAANAFDFKDLIRRLNASGEVDVLYVSGSLASVKALVPQLTFYKAGQIPVLASSSVLRLGMKTREKADLERVMFPASTWQIAQMNSENGASSLLSAMGNDAFVIATNLSNLHAGLEGQTGRLFMDSQGKIRRHFDWYQFISGEIISAP